MRFLDHLKSPEDRRFWLRRLRFDGVDLGGAFPRVVLHAASLGELSGVFPVVIVLRKLGFSGAIVLSVGTPSAYQKAKAVMAGESSTLIVPAPLETPGSVKAFLDAVQPDIFVNFEAEYWPVLFSGLRRHRIPVILVNGRISEGSLKAYKLFYPFFRPIFRYFTRLGMVSETHRNRAISIGANPEFTFVTGSSKYDDLLTRRDSEAANRWRRLLAADGREPVIVAGNLRGRECSMIVELIERLKGEFPKVLGILAPRHLYRVGEIAKEAKARKLRSCLLSEILANVGSPVEESSVVIVDSFGVLFQLYGISDVSFCGGTFEPVGGHNILEPAVWGRKVLYGPSIHKVQVEHEILQRKGIGIFCHDFEEFVANLRRTIHGNTVVPEGVVEEAMAEISGASNTYGSWIMELLESRI